MIHNQCSTQYATDVAKPVFQTNTIRLQFCTQLYNIYKSLSWQDSQTLSAAVVCSHAPWRVCTTVRDKPIAKKLVLSEVKPKARVPGERDETESPLDLCKQIPLDMVPHISAVGCLRTRPYEASLGLSGLAAFPLSKSSGVQAEGDQWGETHTEGLGATGGPWHLY